MKLLLPAIFTVLKVILTILLLPELLAIKLREIEYTMIKKNYTKPVVTMTIAIVIYYNFFLYTKLFNNIVYLDHTFMSIYFKTQC